MIISRTPRRGPLRRLLPYLAGAVGAAALAVAVPSPASAHVHASADSAVTGGYSAVTFRVPNESEAARTTKISVQLPQDTPFLSVSTKPVPGWQVRTTTSTLPKPVQSEGTTLTKAVRTVTWTAQSAAAGIAPGEYQEFSISVGPLPQPGTILLPTTQTYSDNTVVHWDEPTKGGTEPEHPAPELVVTAAEPTSSASGSATGHAPTDTTARVLGGSGLLVGLVGLGFGLFGLRRGRAS